MTGFPRLLLPVLLLAAGCAALAENPAPPDPPVAPAVPDPAAPPARLPGAVVARPPARSARPSFLFLPNGWGSTPEAALKDLDRVMAPFEKKPGFHRYDYVRIVQVGKNSYESDGMCTWDAPDAKVAADPRRNR